MAVALFFLSIIGGFLLYGSVMLVVASAGILTWFVMDFATSVRRYLPNLANDIGLVWVIEVCEYYLSPRVQNRQP